jgi:peptidoglycan/LPS O-acetylase OafA/YrhL
MKPARTSGALTANGFRLDIQGLRGLALVLVLLCHAEVPLAEGGFVGLDVFFVLSGFLITGLIVGEIERTGGLSILGFYARRAKRLLPLAVTVLLVVLAGSLLAFSALRRETVFGDVLAAALYMVNWHFDSQSVDYFSGAGDVSPVQHYWSLSVEEQFYLAWPLLLLAGAWWAGRSGRGLRPALGFVLAPLGLLSLAYSVHFTAVDPQAAYFSTATRIWELALGGILALALPQGLRLGRPVAAALAAAGLAILALSAIGFDDAAPYPGWRAVLPVAGTAAVIVAGTAVRVVAPIRLLTRAPIQYLGRISYAWYLWHWPAIVFAMAIWGDLSPPLLLLVTALAWGPAAVSHRAIEEPLRRSRSLGRRPRRALALGLGCTAAAVVVTFAVSASQPDIPVAPAAAAPGAMLSGTGTIQPAASAVRPHPRAVAEDRGRLYEDGCVISGERTESGRCVYGEEPSGKTVVLLGDSHALQYFPALRKLADRHRWRLVGLVRSGCVVADVDYRPLCNEWRRKALLRIRRLERPALIVISTATASRYKAVSAGTRLDRAASEPLLEAGFVRTLLTLRGTGAKMAVIRDQPMAPNEPAECVAESLNRLDRCAFDARRREAWAFDARAATRVRGVRLIDPLPVLCPRRRCPAVIGNVIVYRDTYHLSATFARTLASWLDRELPTPVESRSS